MVSVDALVSVGALARVGARAASAGLCWNPNGRQWYRLPMKPTTPAAAGAPASARPVSGAWMQDVGAGWLMTSLSSSPSLVALVEAADSFPLMLLALPAGALADIVDRRRLLIAVQVYLLIVAGALGVLTLLDMMTAWMLLGFIFALGVGTAMMLPAWSAIVPDLVPAEQMPSAVALNSVAINAARAVGPAIAGVLVAAVGAWL